jgi:hypothetical protein
MGSCKDCKHWGRSAPTGGATWYPAKHHCAAMGELATLAGNEANTAFIEFGCERGPIEIWTAPDFGCVLFTAKEPNSGQL